MLLEKIWKQRKVLLFLILIFLLAFSVRSHLIKYEYLFGFDSYYHTRMLGYLIEQGQLPDRDPLAYYWKEDYSFHLMPAFYLTSLILHNIISFGAPLTQESLLFTVKILPALFGALISASLFFFMKEVSGKKAGMIAALVAAIVPSFVYRTMSGFFEEDALGFLWLVLGFYFFAKSLRKSKVDKSSLINASISGLLFGIMAWTWQMFLLVPLVMLFYAGLQTGYFYFKGHKKEIKSFAINFAVSLLLFSLIATAYWNITWLQNISYYLTNYLPFTGDNVDRVFNARLDIGGQTIGEENPGRHYFAEKYNALLIFPILALFLIPYNMLRDKKVRKLDFIVFAWILITLFMAFSKLKFTYVFGLPIAASAGYIYANLPKFNSKTFSKVLAVSFMFILLTGIAAGIYFVETKQPSVSPNSGWGLATTWVNENLPEDVKIFNWWDYGHILAFFGKRQITIDNTNSSMPAAFDSARLLITDDETAAYDLVKEYDADYVIVGSDTLVKYGAVAMYAFETIDRTDPRLADYSFSATSCSKQAEHYACNGLDLLPNSFMDSIPTVWSETPLQYSDGKYPIYVYRSEGNNRLYFLQPNSVNPYAGTKTNEAMGVRLFFNDPSLKHFQMVYQNPEVRVFKVVN
ncbi:MAG: hypothetical protein GOV15_03270 [Candidatus Diapherotrites archaeon]|nr:hypothetical protein [Candidatus Diapherotrites archaeon]